MLLTAYKITNAITAVDTVGKVFTVAGNKTHLFISGTFTIAGSTGNNGTYTISSSALNGGNTDITVTEVVPSSVADGNIKQIVGIDVTQWERNDLNSNEPFKYETTVSAGYSDISSSENFDKDYHSAGLSYKEMRNELITSFIAGWGTLSTIDQKAMVRNFVYPAATPTVELDVLYTVAERDDYQKTTMESLNQSCTCAIRQSIDAGSKKYFDHQQGDNGILIITEVTTDQVLG